MECLRNYRLIYFRYFQVSAILKFRVPGMQVIYCDSSNLQSLFCNYNIDVLASNIEIHGIVSEVASRSLLCAGADAKKYTAYLEGCVRVGSTTRHWSTWDICLVMLCTVHPTVTMHWLVITQSMLKWLGTLCMVIHYNAYISCNTTCIQLQSHEFDIEVLCFLLTLSADWSLRTTCWPHSQPAAIVGCYIVRLTFQVLLRHLVRGYPLTAGWLLAFCTSSLCFSSLCSPSAPHCLLPFHCALQVFSLLTWPLSLVFSSHFSLQPSSLSSVPWL